MVVCSTEERTTHAAEACKALGLPFVRFRVVLAEGTTARMVDCDEETYVTVEWGPVWVSLGDLDNVLAVHTLMTEEAHERASVGAVAAEEGLDGLSSVDGDEEEEDEEEVWSTWKPTLCRWVSRALGSLAIALLLDSVVRIHRHDAELRVIAMEAARRSRR